MRLTAAQKAGHVIGLALGLDMLTMLLNPGTGDDATPIPIVAAFVAMGLLILALLVRSWVSNRRVPRRIAAVLLVVNALAAVPGLLVPDVATWMRVDAGVTVVGTIAAIVLMFYPDRRAVLG